jgi:glutamate dehydrogenase
MPTQLADRKAHLIEKIVERIGEKFPASQAAKVARFVRHYFHWVAPEDITERSALDLYGAALCHWNMAQRRAPGKRLLRVYNPRMEEHGWQSTHTIVELAVEDMPFLVDSLTMALNRLNMTVHLVVHPVMLVQRDEHGQLQDVVDNREARDNAQQEAFVHVELDRQSGAQALADLEIELNGVLDDVQAAVDDWQKMRQRLRDVITEIKRHPPPLDNDAVAEDVAFLEWLEQDHFTFLGFREYQLTADPQGEDALRIVPGSSLGLLRNEPTGAVSRSFAHLPPEMRKLAHRPELLIVTKSNNQSTVHRPAYMDYVGIKRFDAAGEVRGEWRFLGLYTSLAYALHPGDVPLLRRKASHVAQRAGFRPGGHSSKALSYIIETIPRDELFQSSEEELFDMAMGILHLQERQRVRLFVRRDPFGRFMSCLVYLPRDRFNTQVRTRIQEVLGATFRAKQVDFTVHLSESVLARIHFIAHTEPGTLPEHDMSALEARIREITHSWHDDLHAALIHELGEEQGNRLFTRYRNAFPASYREDYPAAIAVTDIVKIDSLQSADALAMTLYQPLEATVGIIRFKLLRRGSPIHLSAIMPVLENMGVRVVDERPHEVKAASGLNAWVHDLGLAYEPTIRFDSDEIRGLFQDAFLQVWQGNTENDGFNRLVLFAQLPWRSVLVLRACAKYLRQTAFPFSQSYMEQALCNHPQIACLLVDLFMARFDPEHQDQALKRTEILTEAILQSLESVPSLDEDRIQRRFLMLIQAMLRSNYFQRSELGTAKDYLSFKLDPSQLPDLPNPRPQFEIFVYAPHMEGVHLRGGKVARGGIRWSDRIEDFRTEIFDLMKTQMVKNAVIVPVGAKGGFIVKHPPLDHDPETLRAEVERCYKTLIRGLLDITDNLDGTGVVPPPQVTRYDSDDPYLVVAADKGTASFSDIANAVAKEYDFWLGDAFASGGSAGYDHKKMGITAKGAWESVKRHFREMGKDIQAQDFTVTGIGSMSGDVFGNGMLLSRHIKLVGAFSHSHIFVDPDPDPELSFRERERLFALRRSSWKDYDAKLISKGGGVFARSAKSVSLTPEIQRLLDTSATSLTPNELIRALLAAPVDLLWNGGIGTFVKAQLQNHADVGDRSNDAIRVNADELRCKVVGEGGNLGFTPPARIEYALNGGRISTDFIDNSGGVDCSDHEVNIKILLDGVVKAGDLSDKQRDQLLAQMTDEVGALVLTDNYQQAQALSISEHLGLSRFDEQVRFLRALEKQGRIERKTWYLPNNEELIRRRSAGRGLTRPELSVLLAYSKIDLFQALLASDICEDTFLGRELTGYFPAPLRDRFASVMPQHRLRRELIATALANNIVNRMGITFLFRIQENSGANVADVARAYVAARNTFDMSQLWSEIEALDNKVDTHLQLQMLADSRKLVTRATLWFLRNRKQPLDIADALQTFEPGADELAKALPNILDETQVDQLNMQVQGLLEKGVPEQLARRFAGLPVMFSALDITEVSLSLKRPVALVGGLYFALGSHLELNWLRDQVTSLPEDNRWLRLARSGLRDDLYRLHRSLTREALLLTPLATEVGALRETWLHANEVGVQRYTQQLTDFKTAESFDLALLTVAVSEARKLIQTTGAALPATA